MDYKIRPIRASEYPVLEDFLYQAVYIPDGLKPPPKVIIDKTALQIYIKDFGSYADDRCLVADYDGEIIGAVWTRIVNDFAHIDDDTPSLSISLYKRYRKQGIGTDLMKHMLELLEKEGYKQVSLAVQRANFAYRMYLNVGFEVINESADKYIMAYRFR